ncbi:MAG: acyltransferase [Acidobacteriota bacterium]|nr:acyltransferase [Acidobacteriota bacterium]
MTPPSGPPSEYRADIDGLRAVAVLAVVGYHALPRLVPAGYLGVDVFFVISGFLITRLILDALNAGAFSLTAFYARRARRLFPALALVLACVLAAGWWILLPDEYAALGTQAAAGAAFVANIASWLAAGYFDVHADRKPLLHLWSLGVEEQFYLVWPIVLVAAWRARWNLTLTIGGLALGSLALWLFLASRDPDAAFYLTPSRFWQILAGAILAVPGIASALSRTRPGASDVIASIGLALIAASVFAPGANARDFDVRASLAVAGAMCCIAAAPASRFSRALLSWPPLVGIGLISYPLYLWHWPLLSFLRLTEVGEPTWPARAAAVAASVFLAWATYRWIEHPVRSQRWRAATAPRLGMALGATAAAGLLVAASGGVESRLAGSEYLQVHRGFSVVLPGTESCDADDSDLTQCRFAGVPGVALVGDSHADALFFGFLNSGDARYSQAMVMTQAGCQPALAGDTPACIAHMQYVVEQLRERLSVSLVVLTGRSGFAENRPRGELASFVDGYVEMVGALRASGKRVLLVADVPATPFDPADCVRARAFGRSAAPETHPWCTAFPPAVRTGYDAFLAQLSARVPDLEVFDPRPVFCDAAGCRAFEAGEPQYKDGSHLSHAGSLRVVQALIHRLGG